jgi:hypothetical protein
MLIDIRLTNSFFLTQEILHFPIDIAHTFTPLPPTCGRGSKHDFYYNTVIVDTMNTTNRSTTAQLLIISDN